MGSQGLNALCSEYFIFIFKKSEKSHLKGDYPDNPDKLYCKCLILLEWGSQKMGKNNKNQTLTTLTTLTNFF